MKKLFTYIILVCLMTTAVPVYAEPEQKAPAVTAPSAILIDSRTGKVLYEKNADEKRYPASTTKVMTGLLAVEYGNFDEVVTIGENPAKIEPGSSQISLVPGEQLTEDQLLYGMMLESGNDAAIAIAEHIAGSVEAFVERMNKKAAELGAKNTHFVNPNGLHDDNHYTTVRDMAQIARYAMTLPKFREVVGTVKYTIPATNKQPARDYITNGNKLIWKTYDAYRYEYATGIKTGYTTKSKHCLVSGAKKDDMELIAVVMGAEGTNMYTDSIAMFEYGFSNYSSVVLAEKDQIITTAAVKNSEEKFNLVAGSELSVLLSEQEKSKITSSIQLKEDIEKPVKKGEVLGSVTYSIEGKALGKVDLLSEVELEAPQKAVKFSFRWILWPIGAFLLYRTIVTVYKLRRRKRNRKMSYINR